MELFGLILELPYFSVADLLCEDLLGPKADAGVTHMVLYDRSY